MIKVGVMGAAGYTGGELLRLIINHPSVEIAFAHSNSSAGKKVYEVHQDLLGDTELEFASDFHDNIDVLFLCVGHGDAKKFLLEQADFVNSLGNKTKIIDLSTDFRHHENSLLKVSNQELNFVYGLPELNREAIKSGNFHIANPGCFATCIQLGLLPLAKAGLLNSEIHTNAVTGSTGAGQKPVSTTHFSWRANNLSVYKAFEHQHLKEITESIKQLQPNFDSAINFVPLRGDFARGIFATQYIETSLSLADAQSLYSAFYDQHPFTHLTSENPDMKLVVNTNKCFIHLEKHGNKLMVLSMIDNLLKGASGQAVQNMNLLFGLPEDQGLRLKSIAF
ncbi:MAG: N-acetyl-gamma-glutamyl-phosphate reductase [Cytophagales bacterium]